MKQINKNIITNAENDREPSWCLSCDANDRCDTCDFLDFGEADCDTCDFGAECTHFG